MRKFCYVDVETTGLNPRDCDIWQLAVIIEMDGKVVEKQDFKMAPQSGALIQEQALEMQNMSTVELFNLPDRKEQFKKVKQLLDRYVSKFNKKDKFFIVGYNVKFDIDFLRNFWKSFDDNYFGSYFLTPALDVMGLVGLFAATTETHFKNFKLEHVCEFFGIPIKAHDAMSDIKATRELYYLLKSAINS